MDVVKFGYGQSRKIVRTFLLAQVGRNDIIIEVLFYWNVLICVCQSFWSDVDVVKFGYGQSRKVCKPLFGSRLAGYYSTKTEITIISVPKIQMGN